MIVIIICYGYFMELSVLVVVEAVGRRIDVNIGNKPTSCGHF